MQPSNLRVLITGASGMLGRSLMRELAGQQGYEVLGTGLTRAEPPLRKLDLMDEKQVAALIDEFRPNVVVHCAAERDPDRAAADPERLLRLNVESSASMAKHCSRVGATIIYISTDYVFDGGVHTGISPPYRPDSQTAPVNEYGRSKLAGEEAVLQVPAAHPVVVRVPVLYGVDCEDLSESASLVVAKVLQSAEAKAVDDWGERFPTLVDDVSACLRSIADATQRAGEGRIEGIVHVSAPECITKFQLAKLMAEILGVDASHLSADPNPPAGAPRPRNTQLDCAATWAALGSEAREFTPLREGLAKALERFRPDFTHHRKRARAPEEAEED